MSKVIYNKTFQGNQVESIDPIDFIDNDDVVTDAFGDAHGTFIVTVYIVHKYNNEILSKMRILWHYKLKGIWKLVDMLKLVLKT
jgi:hypothetical protein